MKKQEQLELFPDDNVPRLNETEEALLHYMTKCSKLEDELRDIKHRIGELVDETTH